MEGVEHIDGELHAQPGLCFEAECPFQPQRCIHRYGTLAMDDLRQPGRGDANSLREVGLRNPERFEEFPKEDLPRWNRPAMAGNG